MAVEALKRLCFTSLLGSRKHFFENLKIRSKMDFFDSLVRGRKMFKKFLRHQKYKKMIKVNSFFILEEFAQIVNDAINHFEKEGQIKSAVQKELLKFESMALLFWLFQKTDMFPELWHKLLLDEIHNQYYDRLKKHGYDSKMRQSVCDDFNLRYKTYNDVFRENQDLSKVGAKFVRFLTERAKTDWDIDDMIIPLYLAEKVMPKFEEFRAMMKDKDSLYKALYLTADSFGGR